MCTPPPLNLYFFTTHEVFKKWLLNLVIILTDYMTKEVGLVEEKNLGTNEIVSEVK